MLILYYLIWGPGFINVSLYFKYDREWVKVLVSYLYVWKKIFLMGKYAGLLGQASKRVTLSVPENMLLF